MSPYWPEFLKLTLVHFLAVAAPGPDFAMVVRQSLRHGHRVALWTAVGIGTAICWHVSYSLFGLGMLVRGSRTAFEVVRWAGAAYLAWIGFVALRARPLEVSAGPLGGALGREGGTSRRQAWRTGFVVNFLNPKATLFFVAFFATLVSPHTPRLVRVGYGAWISLTTMAWFSFVAYVFTRERVRRGFLRHGHWIDRALGVVFLAFAASLAASSLR